MNIRRSLLITTTVLASLAAVVPAHARGPGGPHGGFGGHGGGYVHHRGGGWGPGAFFLGAVGLGIGLNAVYGSPWYSGYPVGYPAGYPGYVVVESPPAVVVQEPPAVVQQSAPSTATASQARAAAAVDPVIYPRNGQSATQLDKDRQECVQWAVAQPRALADASVYQRAIAACMDGRGYSLR